MAKKKAAKKAGEEVDQEEGRWQESLCEEVAEGSRCQEVGR